jgi:hypothetical protein
MSRRRAEGPGAPTARMEIWLRGHREEEKLERQMCTTAAALPLCGAPTIQLDGKVSLGSRSGRQPEAFLVQSSFQEDSVPRLPGAHQ